MSGFRPNSGQIPPNPAAVHAEYLLQQNAALQLRLEAIEASTFWKSSYLLRKGLSRMPGIARFLRLSLKSGWWLVTGQLPARLALYRQRQHEARLAHEAASRFVAPVANSAMSAGIDASGEIAPAPLVEPASSLPRLRPAFLDSLFGARPFEAISFPEQSEPEISIILPSYGQANITLRCLVSIFRHPPRRPFEIILAEDASGDPEMAQFASIPGLVFLDRTENLGFLLNCNDAALHARGRFLHFLNNDTEVTDNALDSLADQLESDRSIGLVGSKLVYPDGRLQEAGGIIWNDASGWNFGRGDDPSRAAYRWVRDVDYVSGASIMVPRALFTALGGFDPRYSPAYYEDTDLAFQIREKGYRVVYEPESVVIHHEGASHGTDASSGGKAGQVVNRLVFMDRWRDVLT